MFAYAMALVAGEVEARKFGLDGDPGKPQDPVQRGAMLRMPGGVQGLKPTER